MYERHSTPKRLRAGEIIDFEGVQLKMDPSEIEPGDIYVAERNTGPKLLTAKEVDTEIGCIFPVEQEYPYDIPECVKVELV